MKKILFCVMLSILTSFSTLGQARHEVTYARTGDTLNNVLSKGFQYLYPNFIEGKVHFRTGEVTRAFLNYNILLNEVHFITQQDLRNVNQESESDLLRYSQSLVLDDIDFIVIGADVFVNTPRGIMILVVNHGIQLLQSNKITIKGGSRSGAYGQTGTSSAINAHNRVPSEYDSHADVHQLRLATEFSREEEYYLYQDGKLFKATQNRFERLFPDIKPQIRRFVSDNSIKFTDKEGLEKLLTFCVETSGN